MPPRSPARKRPGGLRSKVGETAGMSTPRFSGGDWQREPSLKIHHHSNNSGMQSTRRSPGLR